MVGKTLGKQLGEYLSHINYTILANCDILSVFFFFFLTLQSMLHFLRVRGICGINPTVFALPNTPNLFRVNISLPIPTAGSFPKIC